MTATVVHCLIYTAVALAMLGPMGNWLCQLLFNLTGLKDAVADDTTTGIRAGWIIGWLERLTIAAGILTHSWEVLATVIALKTVARFKELDDKLPAEYFLVGSLFSVLWAIAVTGGWIEYDHFLGSGLLDLLSPPSVNL